VDVAVFEDVVVTSEVTGADEVVLEDMLGALGVLSDGPPLVVMAGSGVWSRLLERGEDFVCKEVEL
jgi:hypothetical protein